MEVPVDGLLVVGGELGVGVDERAVAVQGLVAVEGEDFCWSIVDNETVLNYLAAVLDVLLELVVVGRKLLHPLHSLAFSLYILLEVIVSLRHRSFLGR